MAVFVGCDLGTLGTKAAVIDESGEVLGEAYEEVTLSYPRPGCVEQDFLEIEASAHRTIGQALQASERASDVAGVAFSGQMSGIGAIGPSYEPATRYDSWLDTRCEPYILRMGEDADRITQLSGCPPTYSHGPKILWWMRERPDDWKRIARFITPGAFVAGRLCGLSTEEAFIDRTYLTFSNFSDTANERWSEELLIDFGVDERVMPRIIDPLDIIGEITNEASETTGLPAGTPVAAGAGDQVAAALGAGVLSPGQAFDSAGTASVFAVCVDSYRPDVEDKTIAVTPAVQRGHYIAFAFVNGGGLGLRWFRDELGEARYNFRELDALAADVPPGSAGLLWFPHLQGRVLPPQPHARGAWIGLTSGHKLGHMYRALLEGIAYEYADWALRAAGPDTRLNEARALGGGSASPIWNQLKADVLGIDWVPLLRQECGVLGDAVIAAKATGHIKDLDVAQDWQQITDPIHPDPDRHRTYTRLLAAYRELGPAIAPVFEKIDDLAEEA